MEQEKTTNIFDDIQKKIIIKEIRDSFCNKGYMVTEIEFVEFQDSKIKLKITTLDRNKIVVEKDLTSMTWKLNALPMGNIMGKDLADVAGDYQYQLAKNKR
jgi:hypothetical protein